VFVWEQCVFTEMLFTRNKYWFWSSGLFIELLLSHETCFGVGAFFHLQSCYYIKNYVLVWEKCFIYGVAIITGIMCWCGSSGSFPEPLFTRKLVVVGALFHLRSCYYLRKHVLMKD
jgi:hypothetical protein